MKRRTMLKSGLVVLVLVLAGAAPYDLSLLGKEGFLSSSS